MSDKKHPPNDSCDPSQEPKDGFDLIDYPLDYQFKAMCRAPQVGEVSQLNEILESLVNTVLGSARVSRVSNNSSKTGKFVSVSIRVMLEDRDELERVYAALAQSPAVLMTL